MKKYLEYFRNDKNMDILKSGFITIDTEDDTKGNVYLYGIYSVDGYKGFSSVDDFLVYLYLRPEKYVFAFNLTYDMFNIFGYNIFKLNYFFIQNRLAKVVHKGKIFLDAYNHWNISIKDAGDLLGLKKIFVTNYTNKVTKKYNKRDCEIAYKFILYMLKEYKRLGFAYKLTIASTSLYTFLQNTDVDPEIDKLYYEYYNSYYGGRVSVFKIGKYAKCYQYDINSAYPYAMATGKYPYPLRVIDKADILKDGITYVKVKSDMNIPILPYRDKDKNVFYPNGIFNGYYCNNELRYFLDQGGKILKIYSGICFDNSEFIFKDYMEKLYNKRLLAKTFYEKYVIKLIANSLYGKFAMKNITTRVINLSKSNIDKYEGDIIGDKIIIQSKTNIAKYVNIIWSAYTTAYVRIYLHKYLNMLGLKNILYCDTDSIITTIPMQKKYVSDTKLGYWKLEEKGNANIVAPKVYEIGNKIKIKGIPKRYQNEGIKNKYYIEKPIKLFEGLRRGIKPNTWISMVKENKYDLKNCVIKNNIVKPIFLKG